MIKLVQNKSILEILHISFLLNHASKCVFFVTMDLLELIVSTPIKKHEKISQKKGARLLKLYISAIEPISSHIFFHRVIWNKEVQTHLNPNGWLYTSSKIQSRDHLVALLVCLHLKAPPPTYQVCRNLSLPHPK